MSKNHISEGSITEDATEDPDTKSTQELVEVQLFAIFFFTIRIRFVVPILHMTY